jgi:hypothetical protein
MGEVQTKPPPSPSWAVSELASDEDCQVREASERRSGHLTTAGTSAQSSFEGDGGGVRS